MKPQTLILSLAGAVTGAFLLAVGLVVAWQFADSQPQPNHQHRPRPFAFNPNQPNVVMDAMPEVQMPAERPIPNIDLPNVRGNAVAAKDYKLSEPHTHGNLAIYLIHGPDTINDPRIMTLQEALANNVASVRYSGGGHLLFIDNKANAPLFIQSGDLVKGGTQDRVLPYDMLVGARTTGTPITAMCVESGRSQARGNESSTSFEIATEQLPTRSLKLAVARGGANTQGEVWNNVKNLQNDLERNTGGSVQAPLSQTSLQLTLEHQRVRNAVQDYFTPLAVIVEGKNDVIGYAVVVNGRVQSADVYGSSALFQKLWPKLLRASAVDALAQRQPNAAFEAPNVAAVQTFLAEAESGRATRVQTAGRSTTIRQESGPSLLFDTCDSAQQNVVLHRSYLAK